MLVPEIIWEIIRNGGLLSVVALLLFLYMRELGKHDETRAEYKSIVQKYEKLLLEQEKENKKILERVLDGLHEASTGLNASTIATEGVKQAVQTVMAFIHAAMQGRK